MEHDFPNVGCPPFDLLGIRPKLACLETVARALLGRGRPTNCPNLWTDAAVFATLRHLEQAAANQTHFEPDLAFPWGRLVRDAAFEEQGGVWWLLQKGAAQRSTIHLLRQRWTNLDWSWVERSASPERDWLRQGHYLFQDDDAFARALPPSFFLVRPSEPTPDESGRHRTYLLGLARANPAHRRRRSQTVDEEPRPIVEQVRRVSRRISF
ncbi:hypothetical protein ACERK3_15690 [Phycisphaerales bacterium AB-hyl4]|uniref:Transposase n=1 Tax=Natronomicrosphaera hydrolytica TaxID=3242702 RepID=A0ABV4UA73_9BACT